VFREFTLYMIDAVIHINTFFNGDECEFVRIVKARENQFEGHFPGSVLFRGIKVFHI